MELGMDDGNGDWLDDEADVGGLPPLPRGEGLYPHGHLMNQLDPVATDFVLASNLEDRARPGADGGLTLEEAPATVALG
jgi:hypothetical protein